MAHGLVLRMKDYLEKMDNMKGLHSNEQTKKPVYVPVDPDQSSEVVQIIRSWVLVTKNSKNSKMEFFSLLRQTLLFMLSSEWSTCMRKNDLLHAYGAYYQKFSSITKNAESIHTAVIEVSNNPWGNACFQWERLSSGEVNIDNKNVQRYFILEPEEVILARCQSLASREKLEIAMHLAKLSFLYQSRIRKSIAQPTTKEKIDSANEEESKDGHASIDWYINILRRKSLSVITEELSSFTCHESIEIICRIKKNPKLRKFLLVILKIFLIQELVKPSTFCCTKKLFQLFCQVHKELHSTEKEIIESARKIFGIHAPTSSHLYLFVDAMWEQFGLKFNSLIQVYTEFYVRGLTADINYLETARNSDVSCDISGLESHIAGIFIKLSTLFRNSSEEAARECTFSAFSLKPSKSKLLYLKNLNQSVQSKLAELSENVNRPDLAFRDCTCSRICNGYCRISTIDHNFVHPLLKKGIRNISYSLVKDLVCILESVRIINFQYNLFNWSDGVPALSSHLQSRVIPKPQKSHVIETFQEPNHANSLKSINSPVQEVTEVLSTKLQSPQALVKRKHSSEDSTQSSFLDVGANIELHDDSSNKKIKVCDSVSQIQTIPELSPNYNSKLKVNDAIEKVIRLSLSNKMTQEGMLNPIEPVNSVTTVNQSFSAVNFQQKDTFAHSEQFKQEFTSDNLDEQFELEIQNQQVFKVVEKNKPSEIRQSVERPSVLFKTNDANSQEKTSRFQKSDRQLSSIRMPVVPAYSVNSIQCSNSINSVNIPQKPLMSINSLKCPSDDVSHSISLPQRHFSQATTSAKSSNTASHSVVSQTSGVNSSKYSSNTIQSAPKDERWKDKFTTFQSKPIVNSNVKNANETYVDNASALNLCSRPLEIRQKPNIQNQTHESQNFKCNKTVTERIINSTLNHKNAKFHQDIRENNTVTPPFMQTQPGQKNQNDRHSVIQHTMQHLGIKIPTQLSVSLNSNTSEQMKTISEKKCSTLSSKVKIPLKNIPKYNTDNPLQPIFHPSSAHQEQNLTKFDNREETSVSGILPPTSVIKRKPCWRSPSVYDKAEVKKAFHSTTSTTKESYSIQKEHFPDSSRQELMKKTEITKKETVYQIYKTKQTRDNYIKPPYNQVNINNYQEPPTEKSFSHSHHNPSNVTSTSSNIIHEDRISGGLIKSTKSCFENSPISSNHGKVANLPKFKNFQPISCFSKDISEGKAKLVRVEPYSRAPILIKENSSKSSTMQVFSKQSMSHNDKTFILKPSSSPSPTSSNSNIYKMHNSISKTKTSQNLSAVTESMRTANSPMTYSPAPSSASSINLASNTNSPVLWDSSHSNSSYYDPSLYSSSSILLEDDKGVVVFKAAKGMPPASQPSIEPTASKTCCSPLEVNPCQTCSVSSDFKHSGSSNSVVELELPSSADNSVNLVPKFPPGITITRNIENIPARSTKSNTIFDDLEHEKYTTCHICSVSCAVSELNTHYGNCHPYELVKRNTKKNINSYEFDSSSLGEKVIYKDHFADKVQTNKSDEMIHNHHLQNDFDDCINLMSSSSFDDIEIFDNGNNPVNYSNQQNYKFSNIFKENFGSAPLVNSESINAAQITEEINLIKPSLNNTKESSSLNEMLEYLTSQTMEVPQFDTSKLEISQSKDFQDPNLTIKGKKCKPNYNPSKHIHCKLCRKQYSTQASFAKHAKQFHSDVKPKDIMDIQIKNTEQSLKSHKNIPANANYPGISNNSQFHGKQVNTLTQDYQLNENVKKSSSNNLGALSKNLNSSSMPLIPFLRKQKKATLKECKYCGAMLTTTFMKQHILQYHSSASSDNNSTGGTMFFTGHPSKDSYQNRPSISIPELHDNIDSNTCLSVSDALNANVNFTNLNVNLPNQMVNIKQEPIDFHSNEEKISQVEDYQPNFQINQCTTSLNNSNSKIQNNYSNDCSYEPSLENMSNSYTCHFCMRKYTSQSYLNKHIRTFHGIQNTMESQLPQEAPILNLSNSNSIMSIPQNNSELFCEGFDEQNMSQNYEQNDFDLLNSLQFDPVNQNDSKLFNNHLSVSQPPNNNNAYLSNSLEEVKIENPELSPFWENVNQPQLNSWPQNDLNPVEIISNQKSFSTENNHDNFPHQSALVNDQIDSESEIICKENTSVLKDEKQCVDSDLHTLNVDNNLNVSFDSKTKAVKFPCEICLKSFTSNYFLQRHKALKHNSSDLYSPSHFNDNLPGKKSEKNTSRAKVAAPNLEKNLSLISLKEEGLELKDLLSFNKKSMDRVKCKICGQYSSHRGNLKTHMINVHKIAESELKTRRRSSQDSTTLDDNESGKMSRRRSSSQDSNKEGDKINEPELRTRRRSSRDLKVENNDIDIALNVQTPEKEIQIDQTAELNNTNPDEVLKSDKLNSDIPFDSSNIKSSVRVRCKLCLKTYSNRGSLKTHMKAIHPNDSTKQKLCQEYEKRGKITKKRVQCNICMKLLWNTSLYLHMKIMHHGLKNNTQTTISKAATTPITSAHKENDLEYIKRIANKSCTQPVGLSSINPDDKKSSVPHSDIKNSLNNSSDNIISSEFKAESSAKIDAPAMSSTASTFCQNLSEDSDSLPPLDELTPMITEFQNENSLLDSETVDSLDAIIPSIMNNITESNVKNVFSDFLNETDSSLEKDPPTMTETDSSLEKDPPTMTETYSSLEKDPPTMTETDSSLEKDPSTMTDIERQCKNCLENLIQLVSQKQAQIVKNCSFPNTTSDKTSKTKYNADVIDENSSICDKPDSFNLIKLIDPALNTSECDSFNIFSENSDLSDLNPSNLSDEQASNTNSHVIKLNDKSKTVLSDKLKCNINLGTESLSASTKTRIHTDKFKKHSKYKESASSKHAVAKDKATHAYNKKNGDANVIYSQTATRTHRNECRVCHKMFRSMMLLSKHLKIVHNIPYLKKLKTAKLTLDEKDSERLSPPPLSYKNFDVDSASQFTEGPQIFSEKNGSLTAIDEDESTLVSNDSCIGSNEFTGVGLTSEMSSFPCSKKVSSDNVGLSLRKRKSSTSSYSLSNSDFNGNFESTDNDFAPSTRYNFRDVAAYSSFAPVASNSDRNKATNSSKSSIRLISSSNKNKSNSLKPPVQLTPNNDEASNGSKSPVPPVVIKLLRSGENFTIENKEKTKPFRIKLKKKGIQSKDYIFHNSTSESFPNSCILTLKYPEDVSNFLREHKQPNVKMERLDEDVVLKYTAKAPHFDANSTVSVLSCNTKTSVSDGPETIDDYRPSFPVPEYVTKPISTDSSLVSNRTSLAEPVLNDSIVDDASHIVNMLINRTLLVPPVVSDSSIAHNVSHSIESVTNRPSLDAVLNDSSSLTTDAFHPNEMVTNQTLQEPVFHLSPTSQTKKSVAVVLKKLKIDVNEYNNHIDNFSINQLNCTEDDSDTKYYLKFPVLKKCSVIINKL